MMASTLGSAVFALVFWIGIAVLIAAALVLRFRATPDEEGLRADPGSAPGAASARLVHRIRRGRVRLSVWTRRRGEGDAGGHEVRVDRRGPDCGDCMDCVNEALRWIREREAAA